MIAPILNRITGAMWTGVDDDSGSSMAVMASEKQMPEAEQVSIGRLASMMSKLDLDHRLPGASGQ